MQTSKNVDAYNELNKDEKRVILDRAGCGARPARS